MYEETLFHLALEQPAAERAAFLAKMCGDDHALRQRVEALLQAHDNPGDFLAQPAVPQEQTVDEPRLAEKAGSRIGPYKLLQQIGEGGMGVVFMAEQTEPVRRRVALKVIKPGMDTRQVMARLEAERQALALMDHPNIAKVFDGGTTDSGRPYFVMQLVNGVPITKYCDEHRLTPQQRLELFIPVCQAVQHAHQKGIIHRDLKPSNVLIASYDGKPVPKVIDFGVAKAVGGGLTDKTLFTDFGAVVGTLEYMSPEQAEPNQIDIDTRSDLYALGVLLYELLTGTTPFERKRLRAVAILECLRIIREEEPQRPSTRLSTTEELPSIAAKRGLEPKKLGGVVRGDLDWIVMKCLEKDRNRRYETANGLAMDLQRHLADETVLASPPSPLYRLRKFSRRHKAGLMTTAAAFAILVLAGSGVGWALWDRAAQESARGAELAGRLAATEKAVTVAMAKSQQSEERANRLPCTTSLEAKATLVEWRDALASLAEAEAALTTGAATDDLRERVAAAHRRIEEGQTQVQRKEKLFRDLDDARMMWAVAVDNAPDHAGVASKYAAAFAGYDLDVTQRDEAVGRLKAFEPEVRDALIVALDDWAVAAALARPGPLATDLRELAKAADHDAWRQRYRAAVTAKNRTALRALSVEVRESSLQPPSLVALAKSLESAGEHTEALAVLRWGRSCHPTDFWIHFVLGALLRTKQDGNPVELEEAIGCDRAALALRPAASTAHYNLGIALFAKKQFDDAIAEYKKAIELDPKFRSSYGSLGNALLAKNRPDDAITEFKKAQALDPTDAQAINGFGKALFDKKQLDDAIAEFNRGIEIDPKYAPAHHNLAIALAAKKRLDDAITEYKKAIDLDPDVAAFHNNLGAALAAKNRWDDAIAEYKKAIELNPNVAEFHNNLGRAFADKNQLEDAFAEYKKAITLNPRYADAHSNLGFALQHNNQLDDAIAEFEKAIALDSKHALAHTGFGRVLNAKNQWDDAIAEFKKAIEIDPKNALAHLDFGNALAAKKQWDDAIAEYKKAIELDPKDAKAHYNLANTLPAQNQWDDAIAEYRQAIALNPNFAEAHCNLGHALRLQGNFTASVEEYRTGHAIGAKQPGWRYPSAQWVQEAEGLVALDSKLTAILERKEKPADDTERLVMARLCQLPYKKLYAASARFYSDAFANNAKLTNDMQLKQRYNAACAAALAGCGQGNDADKLDDKERVRLRQQALAWLRANLDLWTKRLADAKPQERQALVKTLKHWEEDTDLSGIRDAKSLEKLPADEREACQKLWADVAELVKKASETK
jgi:tetratricopeptide (TPR) repeat protein/serine/threonine protein kinase